MEITNNTVNGQFEVRQAGHLAYLTYRVSEGKLYLMHTEVPPPLEGQGIGSALVKHAVGYARQQGLPWVAYCVFARQYLNQHPMED